MKETQKKAINGSLPTNVKGLKKIFYTRNSSTIIENLVERAIKLRGN
ncbi:hypothetical protein QMA56_09560 [Leuconostoc falkenbergense]|nr:hypothetical protein [Leuconostoc falkenbergense]MDI6667949.1 hypothetical protein [Leuconostoc falkenbergense]